MKRVISAKANEDFTLDITFTDGSVRRFDAKPYFDKGIFSELEDWDFFRDFQIAFGTIQWSNEQDFAPETLYVEGVEISKNDLVEV